MPILPYLLLMAIATALPASGPPSSKARLIAETDSIRPGEPFTLGLLVDLPEGWHTYWMNPGDSGMAPDVTWVLPEGFTAGPLQWPFPEPFGEPGAESFGYQGRMLLLSRITPPASLPPGQPCRLKASASWLICRDMCVPEKADLVCVLPARPDAPILSAEWHPLIEKTRQDCPSPAPDWSFKAAATGGVLVLTMQPPAAIKPEILRKSRFFASKPGILENRAPVWSPGESNRLTLKPYSSVSSLPDRLEGVLVLPPDGAISGKRAFQIDVPVQKEPELNKKIR